MSAHSAQPNGFFFFFFLLFLQFHQDSTSPDSPYHVRAPNPGE